MFYIVCRFLRTLCLRGLVTGYIMGRVLTSGWLYTILYEWMDRWDGKGWDWSFGKGVKGVRYGLMDGWMDRWMGRWMGK
jgi:hypothetical protein